MPVLILKIKQTQQRNVFMDKGKLILEVAELAPASQFGL